MKYVCTIAVLALMTLAPICYGINQTEPAKATGPSISVSISTPHQAVSSGSVIDVKITVKNISNHDIGLHKSNGTAEAEFIYGVEVKNAQGEVMPRTRYAQELDRSPAVTNDMIPVLHPGETLDDEMVVSKIVDLSEPDNYFIQVSSYDPMSKAVVKSNILKITVTQ